MQTEVLAQFLAGGLAACSSVTFTNPLEVFKTRLQLQGELQVGGVQKTLSNVVSDTIKEEGIRGIQRGLFPAYIYQFSMNACRLGSYDTIRKYLANLNGGNSNAINIFSGATAGVFGAFVGSPFFLIKTRLQSGSSGLTKYGFQHGYTVLEINLGHIRRILKDIKN
eukprot:NODE_737_length_4687_cov_0.414778.p3 type:complete len:166 gc:universal NODE_737_length_4687_cov_0.414778:1111-614(-)